MLFKDKAGDFLYSFIANKSHDKTKENYFLVCSLSSLSVSNDNSKDKKRYLTSIKGKEISLNSCFSYFLYKNPSETKCGRGHSLVQQDDVCETE